MLLDRLAAGDASALEEIYSSYSPIVYGLAARVTGDRSAAADISQEVFVDLWRRPERFDAQKGSLRSLLCVMSRNRSVDWLRSNGAAARRDAQHAEAAGSDAGAGTDDVGGQVADASVADAVRQAVLELPDEQREAIQLAYFGGHT